ncbi:MAG: glycine betaine/proline transport system substrate-binding protein [Gammaproteobacteria bacterium]|jgi:glycine betaine/proline transport system substrate-binding protein
MFILALFFAPSVKANNCGSDDPIIIPTHNWSSQIVMSRVVGQLLQKAGCNITYQSIDSIAVYEAIKNGKVTLELEVWESSFASAFNAALETGNIIDAGNHDSVTREDWWYPSYVEELCPGLPDWNALEECSKIFAKPDSNGKGVYFDGPVEWQHNNRRIEALEMNFIVENVDNPADLWLKLEEAVSKREPIVLYNWSPNFTDALYGGSFIDFPTYDERCATDQSWGLNPTMIDDCGSAAGGYLKKAAWHQMPEKWPLAYKILSRVNFNNQQIGTMAMMVDIDGLTANDAASQWISQNKKIWPNWLLVDQ